MNAGSIRLAALQALFAALTATASAHEVLLVRERILVAGGEVAVVAEVRQDALLAALGRHASLFADRADLDANRAAIAAYAVGRLSVRLDGVPLAVAFTGVDGDPQALPDPLLLHFTARGHATGATLAVSSHLLDGVSPLGVVCMFSATWHGVPLASRSLAAGEIARWELPASGDEHAAGQRSSTFLDFLRIGFLHIVPDGLDHILFVLGLFLVARSARQLLACVTAFTIAHSLTLALAMSGHVVMPARVVEPLIALSIAAVALERFLPPGVARWRLVIVFAFGLVHGLGFATALRDLAASGALAAPLIGFNLGVEGGQLAVLALAWLVTRSMRSRAWYPTWVVSPASLAIALTGLSWALDRVVTPG